MSRSPASPHRKQRLQAGAFGLGGVAVLLGLVGAWLHPDQFFRAYLPAYLFWLGISLGCLALLMLHNLTGGVWGTAIRRVLEAGTALVLVLVPLAVPLYFGLENLYVWARPEAVATDALLQHKSPYLNVPFFTVRAVAYFVVWLVAASCLLVWSRRYDSASAPQAARRWERRMRRWSGPGLILYALTMTGAAVDWLMSLEPHWFSTIYGVLIMVGQLLAALALAVVVLALLSDAEAIPTTEDGRPATHDLGNLLLAFVMVWAYIAFSQYLIIWSGNVPEEITWYVHRTQGGWGTITILLLVLRFALPFVLLLSRLTKRDLRSLALIAATILVMSLLELFWLVLPAFEAAMGRLHWLDVVLPLGLGGFWLGLLVWQLTGRELFAPSRSSVQGVTEHG